MVAPIDSLAGSLRELLIYSAASQSRFPVGGRGLH